MLPQQLKTNRICLDCCKGEKLQSNPAILNTQGKPKLIQYSGGSLDQNVY